MKTKTIVSGQLFRGVLMIAVISLFSLSANAQNGPNTITRADYLNMQPAQQTDVWNNYSQYTILDLVNWNPNVGSSRNTLIWSTDTQFHATDPNRKHQIISNPNTYIIVDDPALIPLIQITQEEFDALPPGKQDWIKSSGQYQIIP